MIKNPQTIVDEGVVKNMEGGNLEVQQNGIDLTVESISRINGGILSKEGKTIYEYGKKDANGDGFFTLGEGKAYAVEFQQEVSVPEHMCATVVQRSTLNRMGGFIISGLYDSGFKNRIGAVLRTSAPIRIEKGARIAQIIFEDAESASLYEGQYQGK